MAPTLLGVDTGGTFTDFVLPSDGSLRILKVLSTPDDPARAILQGLTELGLEAGPQVLVHGSTVATNAVLEKKGARTGLVTTAGFRDVLETGRQDRPHLYRLSMTRNPPLVPRPRRLEVSERLDERGQVVIPLDEASLAAVVERLQAAGVESAAVCLLFSFANPAHEARVAGALRSGPWSAGADPGPAAYARGGTEPTVTDGHVVLGRLLPERFLCGTMRLDPGLARG